MSHELRTPLNAIIGYSQLLLEEASEEGDEEGAEDLGKIHKSGSNLLYLIDHILDYSRIEAGRMPVNPRAGSFWTEFLGWQGASAQLPHPVTLTLREEPTGNQPLVTDWTALSAIVLNLAASTPRARDGNAVIEMAFERRTDNGFALEFNPKTSNGEAPAIDLSAEVFDTSQDISPTQYGTMGIESALALKYIHLLRGTIDQKTKTNGSLRILFPSIEKDAGSEQAAA